MSIFPESSIRGFPCTCCGNGRHVIEGVRAGRDYMTCKCSRKKCYLCMKCIVHCGCKAEIATLKSQLANFLETAGAEIRDGELVFSSAGYGFWTKRKGGQRTQEILAENQQLKERVTHLLNRALESEQNEKQTTEELADEKNSAQMWSVTDSITISELTAANQALQGEVEKLQMDASKQAEAYEYECQRVRDLIEANQTLRSQLATARIEAIGELIQATIKLNDAYRLYDIDILDQAERKSRRKMLLGEMADFFEATCGIETAVETATTSLTGRQAPANGDRQKAIEFATCTFNDLSEKVNHKDTEKWREVYEDRDDAKSAASYLVTSGLLEKHQTKELFRWTAKSSTDEAASKEQ